MQTLLQHHSDGAIKLAQSLKKYHGHANVLILATSIGGIGIAAPLARALNLPMDVFLIHKLRNPTQAHTILGAVATGGHQLLNTSEIQQQDISESSLDALLEEGKRDLQYLESTIRGHQVDYNVKGHTVIIVDDAVSTGTRMALALQVLKQQQAAHLIVAAPIARAAALERLGQADEHCFYQVIEEPLNLSQIYADHIQIDDAIALMSQAQELRFHDFNLPAYKTDE